MSAIEIPSVPQGPEPASEPVLVLRAEGRAASRWYRQPALVAGIVILAVVVGLALAAPLITSYNPIAQNLDATLLGPSAHHCSAPTSSAATRSPGCSTGCGSDLRIAFIAVLLPFVLGTVLGSMAGYFGGWVDTVIMRLVDIVVAFPFYVLHHRPGLRARPGRAEHLHRDHAGRLGRPTRASSAARSWWPSGRTTCSPPGRAACPTCASCGRHLLPNVISQAIIYAMSDIVQDILAIVTLGYFGLGIPPPTPDLGIDDQRRAELPDHALAADHHPRAWPWWWSGSGCR